MSRYLISVTKKISKLRTAFSTTVPAASRLVVHEAVQDALARGAPVVALESTIITHGLPFPENLNMALKVESIVRAGGATPATIALMNGHAHVGLAESDIRRLAEKKEQAVKVSRRDVAYVLSQGFVGGTTISATMLLAHLAGIDVFVTGGLGGVHRGGESSMDVSADLTELGRTPVAVVCSGVKSILDIGRTLEYLETQGAFVAAYGGHDDFPAFFTAKSGFKAPYRLTSAAEAAGVIHASLSLGLKSGLVIAVPVPESSTSGSAAKDSGDEPDESSAALIDQSIRSALKEADEKGIAGKEITPFVLARVCELTRGASLRANLALVFNNARVGTSIAVELASLRRTRCQVEDELPPKQLQPKQRSAQQQQQQKVQQEPAPAYQQKSTGVAPGHEAVPVSQQQQQRDLHHASRWPPAADGARRRPVVIGGSVLDFMASATDAGFQLDGGGTYRGAVRHSCGGVGRNLADGLSRLGCSPHFLSAVGQDLNAELLRRMSAHVDWSNVRVADAPTAVYNGFLRHSGDVLFGIGDMDIHAQVDVNYVSKHERLITEAAFVCADGNIPAEVMSYVFRLCKKWNVPVFFEPTDVSKAVKPFLGGVADCIAIAKPNFPELTQMYAAAGAAAAMGKAPASLTSVSDASDGPDHILRKSSQMCRTLVTAIPLVVVTLGKDGALVCRSLRPGARPPLYQGFRGGRIFDADDSFEAIHYDALPAAQKVSASGAGDSFGAALMAGIYLGYDGETCMRAALKAAQLSLQSFDTISPRLDASIFSC